MSKNNSFRYDDINSLLQAYPTIVRNTKTFSKDPFKEFFFRIESLLSEQAIKYSITTNNKKITFLEFNQIAIEAAIRFIQQFPMLKHSPCSLRSCFSVPTKNQKCIKGFSLRECARLRGYRPNIIVLEELKNKLERVKKKIFSDNSKTIDSIQEKIESILNGPVIHTPIKPLNDHSPVSLMKTRDLLEKKGFKILDNLSLDSTLFPDFYAEINGKIWCVELKEHSNPRFRFKVLLQLLKYAQLTQRVVIVRPKGSPVPLINKTITTQELLSHYKQEMLKIEEHKERIVEYRLHAWKTLKKIIDTKQKLLSPVDECLLISLIQDETAEDLGMDNMGVKVLQKIMELVSSQWYKDKCITNLEELRSPYDSELLNTEVIFLFLHIDI